MRNITHHIVHCSDSGYGDVKLFRTWHKARGWRDVGYHFIIRRDGEIELGRTLDEIGAHAKGYNRESIGTCLVGRDEFTKEQFASLKRVDDMLRTMFPEIVTIGHRDVSDKPCPNFDVKEILKG